MRQSSVTQVKYHQESTELQYRLVDRAVGLGWPRERVQVIDEDLGRSGAGSVERTGFQKLIAEIGLGNGASCSVSTRLVWRATTATGISFSNSARYSACCWPTASGSTIPAPIMIVCCWACPGS